MLEVDPDLAGVAAGARGQDDHAVCHVDGLLDVVGDHEDDGAEAVAHLEDLVLDDGAGEGVEGRERLVEQDDAGVLDQGLGDGDARRHAARYLMGVCLLEP